MGTATHFHLPADAMMHVGTISGARAAVEGTLVEIGRGAFRTCYASADGKWVYKVANRAHGRQGDDAAQWNKYNEGEYQALTEARQRTGRMAYSPVGLFYVDGIAVVSMPYYPTSGRSAGAEAHDKFHAILEAWRNETGERHEDMHDGNWRVTRKGQVRITDLGPVVW